MNMGAGLCGFRASYRLWGRAIGQGFAGLGFHIGCGAGLCGARVSYRLRGRAVGQGCGAGLKG